MIIACGIGDCQAVLRAAHTDRRTFDGIAVAVENLAADDSVCSRRPHNGDAAIGRAAGRLLGEICIDEYEVVWRSRPSQRRARTD